MMSMPLPEIIAKIKADSGLSEEEINKRIKQKLEILSGLISKEGAAHIIANELGVKLVQEGAVQVKSLLAGMKNVEVTGKIVTKYELREFGNAERKGKVASALLGDETGIIRVVFWNDQADRFEELKEGDVVRISQCLIKDNQGRKELHINSMSKITVNPKGVSIDVKAKEESVRKKIQDLVQGEDNVEVFGTIVQVFDIRFFETCPKCGKRVSRKEEDVVCEAHGVVISDYSYVLNVFLDDGTGNMRIVLWKTQVQRLLKLSHEDIKAFREKPADFEKVKSDLLGNFIKFVGRVNKNEGFDSLEFVPRLVFPDVDPKEEIGLLKKAAPKKEERKEEDLLDAVRNDDIMHIDEEDFEE
jgi:ssDNA-binding replication factor A large subunit